MLHAVLFLFRGVMSTTHKVQCHGRHGSFKGHCHFDFCCSKFISMLELNKDLVELEAASFRLSARYRSHLNRAPQFLVVWSSIS